MLTVRGRFEKGEIVIYGSRPDIADGVEVLVTPLVDHEEEITDQEPKESAATLRNFERVKADGLISIILPNGKKNYQLFDYSKGGLSFLAQDDFEAGDTLQAGITDPFHPDTILLELKLEIRGIRSEDDKNKIGCQFVDSFDEELWHGLQMFWG